MKRKAVIVDMDGTICNNVTGRPWYGDAERMMEDTPNIEIMDFIRVYCDAYSVDVLILTGRHKGEEERVSLEWLDKHWFCPDAIFTRDPTDFSKSVKYKEKVYEEQIKPYYDVIMVFEDNNACVEMFRNKGLVVLQPQNSDY